MIQPGDTIIGPYTITRELGRGGMGVVYLATDTRLGRQVAIKALPPELAQSPDRLERFEREARTLAQLNHPNVAGIYGIEAHEGARYLVLEYVAGETLAERLDRGPLPIDEAIEIAVEIAAGVEAAHEAGVIHRDLKSGNVIITQDGKAKVLDFGLARTDEASSSSDISTSQSPTLTSPAMQHSPTMPGVILGTAAYMSPEQARGRRVDKRTDIWSFGVVLYEMLVGASPFVGETVSDSIGAVLHKDLDLARLPAQTPANVRRVLERCLVRDRSLRSRDIGDLRLELMRTDAEMVREQSPVRSLPLWLIPIGVLALVGVAAVVWVVKPDAKAPMSPVVQSDIALPGDLQLAHSFMPAIALSADGRMLAFPAGGLDEGAAISPVSSYFRGGLYIRRLDEPDAVPVAGADEAWQPAFSPDGSRVAYVKRDTRFTGRIETIGIIGGRPTTLTSESEYIAGLDWSDDGRIVFGTRGGLRSIPEVGGPVAELTSVSADGSEMMHAFPEVLPGGRAILYTVALEDLDPTKISVRVLDTATGQSRELLTNASNARYTSGHLLFARDNSIHAVGFDPMSLELQGEPRPLGLSVIQSHEAPNTWFRSGAAQFTVSERGDLAYAQGSIWPELPSEMAWVDRDGMAEIIEVEAGSFLAPRVDPAGRRLLLPNFYQGNSGIWMHDIARGVTSAVLRRRGISWVFWGPGPDDFTFHNDGNQGVSWATLGDTAPRFTIEPPPGATQLLASEWSRDGRYLLCIAGEMGGETDLAVWSEGDGLVALAQTRGTAELWPTFSPDGRWIAYAGGESMGDMRIFIRPFLREGPAIQVSATNSSSPIWSPDGTELYYMAQSNEPTRGGDESRSAPGESRLWVMAAPVTQSESGIDIGRPERLFPADDYVRLNPIRSWDIGPDGRFLVAMFPTENDVRAAIDAFFPDRIRLIQNWASTQEGERP